MKLTGTDIGRQRFQEICRLHKALVPIAVVHADGDAEKLLDLAYDVQSLLDSAEVSRGEQSFKWRKDIDLVITCLENYNK